MEDNGYGSMSSYATNLYEGLVYIVINYSYICMYSLLFFLPIPLVKLIGYFQLMFLAFIRHRLPPLSTLEMVVPANAVGKVMGKGGANLANIRKVSFRIPIYVSFILRKREIIHRLKDIFLYRIIILSRVNYV